MQDFVKTEGFRTHIKTERYSLEKIEETLSLRENDIRKTECPIVIAGEHYSILFNYQRLNIFKICDKCIQILQKNINNIKKKRQYHRAKTIFKQVLKGGSLSKFLKVA